MGLPCTVVILCFEAAAAARASMPLMPAGAAAPAGEPSIAPCAPGAAPTTLMGWAMPGRGAGALTRTTLPAVCLGPDMVGVTAVLMMGGACLIAGIGGGADIVTAAGCVGSCTSGWVGRLGIATAGGIAGAAGGMVGVGWACAVVVEPGGMSYFCTWRT